MSNPRHPARIADYDENSSFYPKELSYKDGNLYYTDQNGETKKLYGDDLKSLNDSIDDINSTIDDQNGEIEDIKKSIADILYTPISITSFNHNKGAIEMGSTVTSVTLNWAINKTPKTLTLDGETIDVSLRSKTISGLAITMNANKTWTLAATDERDASSTKSTSNIVFYNGVYYGVAAQPSEYNSAFIKTLTKELRGSIKTSFSVTAGADQYIYYCIPSRMKASCTFAVGGFTGGFSKVATIDFTNDSNYTEKYDIYRSDKANLGSTNVTVS